MSQFNSTEEVIQDIKAGKIVIILDDEDRENEGDFLMAASKVEPHHINFMATFGRGLICTPLSPDLAEKFELNPMVTDNNSQYSTAFTVTIDARENISTGISSYDRAHTIQLLVNDKTKADDFIRPGHIFPLIAHKEGVLKRAGHTEAAVEFAKLAGLPPVGVICEILKHDGTMMRRDDLFELAKQFSLKISTIKQLQEYLQKKNLVDVVSDVNLPNKYGSFRLATLRNENSGEEHILIYKGKLYEMKNNRNLLVRLHSECFTGDLLGSERCDCGQQLSTALQKIEEAGQGMVIYLKQEGRGIGLVNKIKAYALQEQGMDTIEANIHLGFKADERTYDFAVAVLKKFGIESVELMSNNPQKLKSLTDAGIKVSRLPLEFSQNANNSHYLQTKKNKMGHILTLVSGEIESKASKGIANEYH